MKEIELAKIIEQMVPQLYLLDHPIRPNWGNAFRFDNKRPGILLYHV